MLQSLHIDREQSREVVPTTATIDVYTGATVDKGDMRLYYPKQNSRLPKVGGVGGVGGTAAA